MLTAPLFGIAGAALLLWGGADALQSRWQPLALAALHCFTAGFMLQAMVGALWQVMPVVGGVVIARQRLAAGASYLGLVLGATLLALGLSAVPGASPRMVTAGATLLALAIGILIAVSLPGLVRSRLGTESGRLLALALVGLGGTAIAGLVAAQALFGATALDDVEALIDLHAIWALAGWALPLVAAVALQFVPMFYMTEPYPRLADVYLACLGAGLLLAAGGFIGQGWLMRAGAALVAVAATGFAAVTLSRFAHRRRPRQDATSLGWQLAMTSLLAAVALLAVRMLGSSSSRAPAVEVAFGVFAVLGVFVTLIGAMLLRILPFLASLHLAAAGGGWRLDGAPSERWQQAQVWLQFFAASMLALAAGMPELARTSAALLLASQVLLARNVWGYAWALWRARRAVHQT